MITNSTSTMMSLNKLYKHEKRYGIESKEQQRRMTFKKQKPETLVRRKRKFVPLIGHDICGRTLCPKRMR